jgi:hypothetical protein
MATEPEPGIHIALIGYNPYFESFLNGFVLHLDCILRAAAKREHSFVDTNMSCR